MDFSILARLESDQRPPCFLNSLISFDSLVHSQMAIHDPRKRKKSSVEGWLNRNYVTSD